MNEKLFKELLKGIDQMRAMDKGLIKPHRVWTINPVTRVKASKKLYKRQRDKKVSEE